MANGHTPWIIQPPSTGRAVPDMRRLVPPRAKVRLPIHGDSYTGAMTSSGKAQLHRLPPAAAHTTHAVAPHPAANARKMSWLSRVVNSAPP